jgi:hypothetical protein
MVVPTTLAGMMVSTTLAGMVVSTTLAGMVVSTPLAGMVVSTTLDHHNYSRWSSLALTTNTFSDKIMSFQK